MNPNIDCLTDFMNSSCGRSCDFYIEILTLVEARASPGFPLKGRYHVERDTSP